MSIATVSLSPAIDQTVRVDNFKLNTVNRGQSIQFDAGGKGVNVASFLADYGYPVAVTGHLGAENPTIFEQLFQRKGIADHFIRIPGPTRISVKIVDEANQQTTDINMPGLTPTSAEIDALLAMLDRLADTCDWFVLAGNMPPGVPTDLYATLIRQLTARGRSVALDTSHDALREGVAATPTLVKPNIHELEQLVGQTLDSDAAIEQAARQLIAQGIQWVVVSMGERGALFVDSQTTLFARPPRVVVKSTVGAGDAMVAGLIAGQVQGLSLADTARLATAFSAGKIGRVGPHLPDRDTLQSLFHQVTVNVIHRASAPMSFQ